MYLNEKQVGDYRQVMIDPFLENETGKLDAKLFDGYIKRLMSFVFGELEKRGLDMDYESSVGEQTGNIASIRTARQVGTMVALRLEMRQTLAMEQKLVESILSTIDIEECDDMEAAFVGAFSVLLHEIGHHIDWTELSEKGQFISNLDQDSVSSSSAKEVMCDKIGFLLSKVIPTRDNKIDRERIYMQSKLGLLVGYLVRLRKGLYEGYDENVTANLIRFLVDFEKGLKLKAIGEETRNSINRAMGDLNLLINDFRTRAGYTDDQTMKLYLGMKRVNRSIDAGDVNSIFNPDDEGDYDEADEDGEECFSGQSDQIAV